MKRLTPERRYDALVAKSAGTPGVGAPSAAASSSKRFGADALKIHDKIFAMLVRGRFVVKLPAHRVTELIGSGEGAPFDAGRGRPMKEWVRIEPGSEAHWPTLATEAMSFVASRR